MVWKFLSLFFKDKQYRKRVVCSLCPRAILKLDPSRNNQSKYWQSRNSGDNHGFEQYDTDANKKVDEVLFEEVSRRITKDGSILDLGCNCGRQLNGLKSLGFNSLTGIDICKNAIDYGKKRFDLKNVEQIAGRHETVLPRLVKENRKFDLVYSSGAMMTLVHPSFDIIKHICALSKQFVILLNEENEGHSYPRLTEYEFNRQGFVLIKFLRPLDGSPVKTTDDIISSLAVYEKAVGEGKSLRSKE